MRLAQPLHASVNINNVYVTKDWFAQWPGLAGTFHDNPRRKASCRCSDPPVAAPPGPTMRRMLPSVPILVPARSSRHRFACLSLYRALLRSARDIEVSVKAPDDIKNPIRWLIRGQFRRNRKETNPRFIYSSLSAGYKVQTPLALYVALRGLGPSRKDPLLTGVSPYLQFLDLFAKAKFSGSAEHASITEHVRSRLRGLEAWRARQPAKEPPKKEPPPPPLLRRLPPKTNDPDERPVFVSDILPRPKSALKGPRKIPRLCITSFDVPFLRFKKPQSERLSQRLLSQYYQASERTEAVVEIKEKLLPDAELEDRWEREMRRRAREEWQGTGRRLTREEQRFLDEEGKGSHVGCMWQVLRQLQDEMTRKRTENIARAEALLEIVKKEKALAAQEAREAGNDATG